MAYRGKHPLTKFDKNEENKKEAFKQQQQQLIEAYQAVFSGNGSPDEARKVYLDLLRYTDTFGMTMTGNSWTYFNEGKRDVGRRILRMTKRGLTHELLELMED